MKHGFPLLLLAGILASTPAFASDGGELKHKARALRDTQQLCAALPSAPAQEACTKDVRERYESELADARIVSDVPHPASPLSALAPAFFSPVR